MAEVIGLVASVITLAETAVKLGRLINRLHEAPAELLALSNEIENFRVLLYEVEKVALGNRPQMAEKLSETLCDANSKVLIIRGFLERVDADDAKAIDRLVWIRHKGKIRTFQSQLRDARLHLSAMLDANTS
ncbi:uncharacterized protein K452DRAFT_312628 [Aplosporella prunicola CBS 121167]|uniref:NACHT-NTPase and P-loop NTPases N-terminal domain-containing protein n=1 Tax=Aplosporella prunicola CBS 121167 TaxID=1176127 RepID=A0A6A6B1F5_9PEZI|nr:uncharacterized protein K452DRAFT_312628 [Aplosporella prunicola CBS 121167]KAF2137064.1 hypothetical protein K452DRAFT_312628 [Aplosporella prunicola CBS 121167]